MQNIPLSRPIDGMSVEEALAGLRWPQQIAVMALLEGGTKTAAAAQANVDRRTLHTWLGQEDVAKALAIGRAELAARVGAGLDRMLDSLSRVMDSPAPEDPGARRAWMDRKTKVATLVLELVQPFGVEELGERYRPGTPR